MLLGGMVAQPQAKLSQLPLLTAGERRQLLVEWNATQADYPQQCLHELVQETLRGSALASLPFYDRAKVIALLDGLPALSLLDSIRLFCDVLKRNHVHGSFFVLG